MGDGHLNKCKECCKIQARNRYTEKMKEPDWIKQERLRGRIKSKRYKHKASKLVRSSSAKKYTLHNKDKRNAANHVKRKLGSRHGLEAHHWSYNKEHYLSVFWLSPSFHGFIHRFMEYSEDTKMYMRLDTKEALDTRDKHKRFMESLIDEYECEMQILVNTVYIKQLA